MDQHSEGYIETSVETTQLDENIDFATEEPLVKTRPSNIYQARQMNCYNVVKINKLNKEKEFAKAKT